MVNADWASCPGIVHEGSFCLVLENVRVNEGRFLFGGGRLPAQNQKNRGNKTQSHRSTAIQDRPVIKRRGTGRAKQGGEDTGLVSLKLYYDRRRGECRTRERHPWCPWVYPPTTTTTTSPFSSRPDFHPIASRRAEHHRQVGQVAPSGGRRQVHRRPGRVLFVQIQLCFRRRGRHPRQGAYPLPQHSPPLPPTLHSGAPILTRGLPPSSSSCCPFRRFLCRFLS